MGYDNIMVFVEEYDITSFVKLFVWIETEFRLQRNGYVGVGTILKLKHLEVSHARLKCSLYICLCIDRAG